MTLLEYFENKANRQAYFWEKEILQQVQNAVKQIKKETYLMCNCPSRSGKMFLMNCINEYYKFERKETMEQRLQELKEKIRDFVIENKVTEFYVDIERGAHIPTDVELTIKV